MEPVRATSGSHLVELIRNTTPLVTTIINKFDTGMRGGDLRDESADIFVLVDESHRSQTGRPGGYGTFALRIRRLLTKACYPVFTGTQLLTKAKNTTAHFGCLLPQDPLTQAEPA